MGTPGYGEVRRCCLRLVVAEVDGRRVGGLQSFAAGRSGHSVLVISHRILTTTTTNLALFHTFKCDCLVPSN